MADFVDAVANMKNRDHLEPYVIAGPNDKSISFTTEEGYSCARDIDKNNKNKYEYTLKGPDLELYKYWKQAKFDRSLQIEPGLWTDNSLVHTIDLKDPSATTLKDPYFQGIKYQIGNRGMTRSTKLLEYRESEPGDKPHLDVVELDHNRKFSNRLSLMDGDFYKA